MNRTTPKFHSLSRRIILQFCLFTIIICGVQGLFSFVLMYTLEDSFIEKSIFQEAETLADGYQSTGKWPTPQKPNMQLYFSKQSLPEDIRQLAIDEPLRKEFYGSDNRHYHLHTMAPANDVYLVAEVSNDLFVRPIRQGVIYFLSISALVLTLIACLIAYLIGRKTVRPLKELADLVDGVAPENIPKKFAQHYPNNEIGILARTLEVSMQRISHALNREKAFTRDVSHELRTPLAVIKNGIEVQRASGSLSETDGELADRIEEAAQQMQQTVTTLLALAREEHANAELKEIQLMPIVERAILDNSHLLEGKDIAVEVDDNCHANVKAQEGMLKILLNNLLGNAFQYTESGKVNIEFLNNRLIVTDTGPGIDESISEHITEPAIKGKQSTGFGFGLSIVKRLCEHQHWQLDVVSGQGTSVSVLIQS